MAAYHHEVNKWAASSTTEDGIARVEFVGNGNASVVDLDRLTENRAKSVAWLIGSRGGLQFRFRSRSKWATPSVE